MKTSTFSRHPNSRRVPAAASERRGPLRRRVGAAAAALLLGVSASACRSSALKAAGEGGDLVPLPPQNLPISYYKSALDVNCRLYGHSRLSVEGYAVAAKGMWLANVLVQGMTRDESEYVWVSGWNGKLTAGSGRMPKTASIGAQEYKSYRANEEIMPIGGVAVYAGGRKHEIVVQCYTYKQGEDSLVPFTFTEADRNAPAPSNPPTTTPAD